MRYIISLFVLLSTGCLYGQSLQVSVRDNNGTLPYASIYINKNQSSVTDSEGIAYISFDKLNYGDTITSTYIGMKASSIIYNKQMQGLSKCTIVLDNNLVYELDPVVVKAIANDDWKFFHKSVKTYNTIIFQSCIVKGKFKAKVFLPHESISQNIEGSFELKNIIPRKLTDGGFFKYYFTTLPEITTSVKDTTVKNKARSAISRSINVTCQTISRIKGEHSINYKYSKVTYLGLNDNCHFFRIVYTDGHKDSPSYQILFSVNKDNQEIETVDFDIPLQIHSGSLDREKFLSANCQKLVYKKGKKETILTVPAEIEYNNKFKDNTMINLILSDVTFQVVN